METNLQYQFFYDSYGTVLKPSHGIGDREGVERKKKGGGKSRILPLGDRIRVIPICSPNISS
jgi:hypothetical protein